MTPRGPDVEYLELARTDPKKAIDALDDLLLEWNGPAHTALRSTILRGAAIAMRFIGDIPGSDRYLRRAIDEAVTAGNHRCTVEAQITMSGNVMLQGDTTGALELLRSLDPRGDHSLEAQIKVQ